ncbi:hypothetical protein AVEN_64763-1 [Araneus ventricosus]|uniref:Uncharacterized protein n=1 Tax=Araneus ventricosus TaxID=182803 RepID=A0A4Y2T9G0_ARAVE|nr:hypothetical protein AVEN_64763-1 [Araneus ventricosus]
MLILYYVLFCSYTKAFRIDIVILKVVKCQEQHLTKISSVILMSHLEAMRGLFWDGPCNFEPQSDDKDDNQAGTPSPNFHATPTGEHLATMDDLTCNRPHTRWIFSGIGFRTWSPLAPKPRPYH